MKALKKMLVLAVCAALTLTVVPETTAEAASVLASYSFDDTTGLTDPGLGILPSIVDDAERGKVLQFADGESSSYKTDTSDAKGVHLCEVVGGSPSAYEIANPYENGSYTSMTYSFWVKVTDPAATTDGAGILGWVSAEYTSDHPDARDDTQDKTQDEIGWYEKGCYVFGTSCATVDLMGTEEVPMLNFAGLYHNWYVYKNEDYNLADDAQWHHIIVTTDSSAANTKIYIDGNDLGGLGEGGKRWNKGENDTSNKANTLEPTLMETICWSGTKLYLGQTGSNPTSSAVYIDDVTFYDSMVTAAEAMALYNDAKASTGSDAGENSGNDNSGSTSDDTSNQAGGNDTNNNNSGTSQTGSNIKQTNKNNGNKNTTPNLPQTGVMSTTALVGIGVAVIGAGSVLLRKKKED